MNKKVPNNQAKQRKNPTTAKRRVFKQIATKAPCDETEKSKQSMVAFILAWLLATTQSEKDETLRLVTKTSTTTRRNWLQGTIIPASLLPSNPSLATTTDDNDCSNGVLSYERAVPGAYENRCMYQPVRQVPITPNVVLSIRQDVVQAGSTGLAIWNSSLILVRVLQMLSTAQFWKTHPVVMELGCGPALASLAASALGARKVVATDGNPKVVELAERNIQDNDATSCVQAKLLSWGLLDAMDYNDTADLIIGSDLTYNPAAWPLLADTMATVLKPEGIVVYLTTGHAGFDVQGETDGFLSVAKSRGLVPVSRSDAAMYPFEGKSSPEQVLLQSCRSKEECTILGYGLRVSILRRI